MAPPTPLPDSITRLNRTELTDVPLVAHEGVLPQDLYGHLFVIGTAGCVDEAEDSASAAVSIFNGDGMIYRYDFADGRAAVKTRLAATPCYYADIATNGEREFFWARFTDYALLRWSLPLGLRNQANTAFLPMGDGQSLPRLLLTYDAGRHVEIDTDSLAVVTAVGSNREWDSEALDFLTFPPAFSTAHPGYDPTTGEMFTVNYAKSTLNLLHSLPMVQGAEIMAGRIESMVTGLIDALRMRTSPSSLPERIRAQIQADRSRQAGIRGIGEGLIPEDYTYVVRWDGEGGFERWRVVLPDGTPVSMSGTVHQIGLTRHYVVLADTAFKIDIDQLLNNPFSGRPRLDRATRWLFNGPQMSRAPLYLVRREHLKNGQKPAESRKEVPVRAVPVVLPLELDHFLVDFDDDHDRLTLHVAHCCASDVAEWVRTYDTRAPRSERYDPGRFEVIQGMLALGQMDINRLARYEIDARTGAVREARQLAVDPQCWGVALYAGQKVGTPTTPPARLEHVYWTSMGFFSELTTQYIYDLYRMYPNRLTPLEVIDHMLAADNKPSTLFRLDTDKVEIGDSFTFPNGVIGFSPQFVPRRGGDDRSQKDGYIVCTVFTRDRSELWVFDASSLSSGPVCQLHSPDLAFGLSLHSAWLPEIGPRTAQYCVSVEEDTRDRIKYLPGMTGLFEAQVYPHFPG